jgi:putative ABC transport system substrate-binding protein
MKRREFISLLGGAAAASPLAARAQQIGAMRRVGVLMGYAESDAAAQTQVAALRQELRKLGWEEGRNIRLDVRFPAADAGKVRAILMELMSLTPDVLVSNTNLVTAVVQSEVRTIPIVFIFVGDPVGSGFVSNDARPNGNLTGFANWDSPAMSGKWLELLKEVAPQVERVGFMMHRLFGASTLGRGPRIVSCGDERRFCSASFRGGGPSSCRYLRRSECSTAVRKNRCESN